MGMHGLGRAMVDLLDASAECEELDLPSGEFVAKIGKLYKIVFSVASLISFLIGIPGTFIWREDVGIVFLIIGILLLLILPTMLSYRCVVNKTVLEEKYFILFIKFKKEVLWRNVKYKKIKLGNNKSIKLYDKNKKRLISFDGAIVGFNRILKIAKQSSIKDYKEK